MAAAARNVPTRSRFTYDTTTGDIVINDIEVLFDIKNVTQTHVNFITDLCQILDANELEIGNFDYDIFNLVVNKIQHYDMDLIKCNN